MALGAMWGGAFGSKYAIMSSTLLRSIPLIIVGLGIALAFRAGALNIGGEGQFYAGAIAATAVGVHLQGWPAPLAVVLLLVVAALAGAIWAAAPAWLRVRYGVMEAISTLLLNFVALALVSWAVTGPLQEARHAYPQSDPVALSVRLPLLFGTRLHVGIIIAIVLAIGLAVVFARTRFGFALKAVGANPRATALVGRVDVDRVIASALLGSGGLAGLAGGIEVAGVSYALFQNLSPGYGFTAIAVALLARLDPLGVVVAGVLFGALESGAAAMQRDAGVPSVAVYVVEAVVIIVVLLADRYARARAS
ncbi:MAG TPA: ABC transporter permease [Gemmatimonadales bacterium]|nr:ABC transporter permease [Gemmatimonadales bacterium]